MEKKGDSRYDKLLADIHNEFPKFAIVKKSTSRFHLSIDAILKVVTLGKMQNYVSDYQTTISNSIAVTDHWFTLSKDEQYCILRHELVHLRQFRRYGFWGMSFLYLLVPLPMGFAYCRAAFEKEAYEESIRAHAEVYGLSAVKQGLYRDHIIRQFTSASYGWMWPFRKRVIRWYNSIVEDLQH